MQPIEVATAIRYASLAAKRPNWWLAFLQDGRAGLLRKIVADSVGILRQEQRTDIARIFEAGPTTPLGLMGAPQEYLYRIVRATAPSVVLETGIYRGISSAFILAGLHDNAAGQLFSIDLPSATYVEPRSGFADTSPLSSREKVGFAVPKELRGRWTVRLGDVRTELPRLLAEQPKVQMFYHDSEHTYELMTWEYEQVIPHLSEGGLLTSDDTNWNSAFSDCVRRHGLSDSGIILGRLGVASIPRAVH